MEDGTTTPISTHNSPDTVSMMNFPGYNAGDFSFSQYDYVYPLDSLPGPVYTSSAVDIKITHIDINDRRIITFTEALPADVEVGMDIWTTQHDIMYVNPNAGSQESSTTYNDEYFNNVCFGTYQIESIDSARTGVVLDQPMDIHSWTLYNEAQALLENGAVADGSHYGWPNKAVHITSRRVPFQTRSVGVKAMFNTLRLPDVCRLQPILGHSVDPGDYVYPIIDDAVVNSKWEVLAVTVTPTTTLIDISLDFLGSAAGQLFVSKTGDGEGTPMDSSALTRTGIFIHRINTERRRWAMDAKMLKLAPTTFSYDTHQYNAHEIGAVEPAVQSSMVHNLQYPLRLLQGHDDAMLRRQVVNTVKEIRRQSVSLTIASQESEITIGEVVEELPASLHNIPTGVLMRTARVFDMGITAVEDAAPNTSQRWGSIAAVARLPTPYTTVNAEGPGVNDGIWEFVAANR